MLMVFPVALFLIEIVYGDVITLKKGRNVTCVLTEEDIHSGVYLRPFSTKNVIPQNFSKILWEKSGWIPTNSSDASKFEPITDCRWNDLPEFKVKAYRPTRRKFDISLSVCSVVANLTFNMLTHENTSANWTTTEFHVEVARNHSEKCSWVHLTICNKKGSIALIHYQGGDTDEDIRKHLSANSWIRFERFPNYTVKQHLYNFRWSESVSKDPSTLNLQIFRPGVVCVNFYVSINRGCQLDIFLKADNKTINTTKIDGFNQAGKLKIWKYIRIEENLGAATKGVIMELYRSKTSTGRGYWAIDHIRYCNKNAAIYTATLDTDEEHATCQTLQDNTSNKPSILPNQFKAGCLGDDCKVKCKDVLGPSFEFCQDHKLCTNDHCSCAWGYKEDSCKEKCSKGTWGMNCLNNCKENCKKCNPINGTCDDLVTTTSTSTVPITLSSTTSKINVTRPTLASILEKTTSSSSVAPISSIGTSSRASETTLSSTTLETVQEATSTRNLMMLLAFLSLFTILFIMFGLFLYRKMTTIRNFGYPEVNVIAFEDYIKQSVSQGFLLNQFKALVNVSTKYHISNAKKDNFDIFDSPHDDNYLLLKPIIGKVDVNDHLNARFIDGWSKSKAYIVTQGPNSLAIPDFWWMVWQHNVTTIVMVSNSDGNLERECAELQLYANAKLQGEVGVNLVGKEFYEYYEKRIFEICYERYRKIVTHYYLTWKPELGKPLYPNDLVPLVQIMNENYKNDWSPIVVHCDFGVGRAAILILCDIAFQMAKSEGYLNVYYLAKQLKEQMPHVITTQKDYILAHLVVSECLMAEGDIFHKVNSRSEAILIDQQLEYLNTLTWHDKVIQEPSLSPFVEYQDRFSGKVKYFYAKQPKSKGVEGFWKTVLKEQIKTVLFLNETDFTPCSFGFKLPNRKICTIDHLKTIHNNYTIVSKMLLKEQDKHHNTLYEEEISVVQLLGWNCKGADAKRKFSTQKLIQLVEDVRNLDPCPENILICCSDGISESGLFIAMSLIIRKYLQEMEYDVPNIIRCLRRSNKAFMSKSDELRLLYRTISTYSKKFDSLKCIHSEGISPIRKSSKCTF